MRTIHKLVQGSPEWHHHRRSHLNASEAPAMMGLSEYMSREELVRRHALGLEPEIDEPTQRRFDDGHAFEEIARPWAEEIIGESLYPIVVSLQTNDLRLSASYDGATMAEDSIFEHKSLNAELAAALERGEIPEAYWPQMEQQLLVLGATKCLFMASKGERESMRFAWYESKPGLRARLLAGWKQFLEDVASYQHVEVIPKAVSSLHAGLPSVVIEVQGQVDLVSNLDRVAAAVRAYVERIPVKPATDEEFADCELAVKELQTAQERLEAAADAALAKFTTVEEMRNAVSNLVELVRATRLRTEKLVKARKDEIREEIRQAGAKALADHIAALNDRLGGRYMPAVPASFSEAMRGKKTVLTLRDAVNAELARAKIEASQIAEKIERNLKFLSGHEDSRFLFADLPQIVMKECEHFELLVATRIRGHQAAQARKEAEAREKSEAAIAAAAAVEQPVVAAAPVAESPAIPARQAARKRPSDMEIVAAVADAFRVSEAIAIAWLAEMNLVALTRQRVGA